MRVETVVHLHDRDHRGYWKNLGEATSQFIHAIVGGNANLTVSAQCGYWWIIGDLRGVILPPIVDLVFGNGHCRSAWKEKV